MHLGQATSSRRMENAGRSDMHSKRARSHYRKHLDTQGTMNALPFSRLIMPNFHKSIHLKLNQIFRLYIVLG